MSDERPQVCGESATWGPELALGLLSGSERAAGLSHMAACPVCREEVDDLARVADGLLMLAPDVDPPVGFESRVLAATAAGSAAAGGGIAGRVGGSSRPGGRRGGLLVALVAAAVIAAAVGGGVVATALRSPGDEASPPQEVSVLRTGLAVSASGRTSCRVVVSGTRPASVLVSMDGYPGAESEFVVEMVTGTGAVVPLGAMAVSGGHGLLVRSVDSDAGDLHLMRMVDREGRVVYEATLADAVPSPPPIP